MTIWGPKSHNDNWIILSDCNKHQRRKDYTSTSSKQEHFPQGSLLPTWSTHLMRAHSKIHQNTNVQVIYASSCIHLPHVVLEMITAQTVSACCYVGFQSKIASALQSRFCKVLRGGPLGSSLRWWTCCATTISRSAGHYRKKYQTKKLGFEVWTTNSANNQDLTGYFFFVIFCAMSEHAFHFKNVG